MFLFLDIEKPQIRFEEQIEGLKSLAEVFNQIFGENKWCFSNGTALAIHSFSQGIVREITDIDVFLFGDGVDVSNVFPNNFFNIPFGRVKLVEEPLNAYGIDYLEPQLRAHIFLDGCPMGG